MNEELAQSYAKAILGQLGNESLTVALEKIEKEAVKLAMARSGGNCHNAAQLLNLNRTNVVEKRRKYRLDRYK